MTISLGAPPGPNSNWILTSSFVAYGLLSPVTQRGSPECDGAVVIEGLGQAYYEVGKVIRPIGYLLLHSKTSWYPE